MSIESKHTWKVGLASDAIVDTAPCREGMSKDSFAWYGGNLICESVDPRHRLLILAAPALLEALEQIASENYDDDDKRRHLASRIDEIKKTAKEALKQAKP